jgi:hypothetical protein
METITDSSFKEILQKATHTIISEPENFGGIYTVLHEFYPVYSELSGISAGDITDADIMLPTGKAVSPVQAAHCLLEFQRTAVFVRSIYRAVLQLKTDFPSEVIRILYAGCGPYATLLTPLVTLFSPLKVTFTFLDINEISLEAVKRMYERANLTAYVKEYVCADAAVYQISDGSTIHLAVSETMQQALVKEAQVAIMQNLIPQLSQKALFVPMKITVSAQLQNGQEEQIAFETAGMAPRRVVLGDVYSIGREDYEPPQPVTFNIPEQLMGFTTLFLHTRIQTFGDEVLTDYQCSLTSPKGPR